MTHTTFHFTTFSFTRLEMTVQDVWALNTNSLLTVTFTLMTHTALEKGHGHDEIIYPLKDRFHSEGRVIISYTAHKYLRTTGLGAVAKERNTKTYFKKIKTYIIILSFIVGRTEEIYTSLVRKQSLERHNHTIIYCGAN